MGIYDVPKADLVESIAKELKNSKDIQPPAWSPFVKTGIFKERLPKREDWWHVRAAGMLIKVSKLGPIGVSKLRTLYGGRKHRGVASEHFYRGSGSIARKILQQLEKAGLIAKGQKGVHKGRLVTPKGLSLLGKTSNVIMKEKGIVIKPVPKHAELKPLAVPGEAKPKRAPRKARAKQSLSGHLGPSSEKETIAVKEQAGSTEKKETEKPVMELKQTEPPAEQK